MHPRPSTLVLPVAALILLGACTPAPRDGGSAGVAASPSRTVTPDTNPMEAGRPPSIGGPRAVTPILTR